MIAAGTCYRCKAERFVLVPCGHRARYGNGTRAVTVKRPICGPCALELAHRYNLAEEGDEMGKSYFVEDWHADGLRWAADPKAGPS